MFRVQRLFDVQYQCFPVKKMALSQFSKVWPNVWIIYPLEMGLDG
jgi:hypothetical protein